MGIMRRLLRDESGATMIMVAVSMVMIFAFAVLAIDISLIELAKNQLQNAADAAALGAAIEYAITVGDETAATAEAVEIARLNRAIQDVQLPVMITPADVSFPTVERVRVQTHRTVATGDPVQLYFLRVINAASNNLGEMVASATAEVIPLTGSDCLKPWMFPDMWDDADGDDEYDSAEPFTDLDGDGQYDLGEPYDDDNHNLVWDDAEFYDPLITGYRVPESVGSTVILKMDNGAASVSPREGWYQIIRFGPVNRGGPDCPGGDCYREWIPGCEPYLVMEGDTIEIETGAKVGPTDQGLQELIARDPGAYYDAASGTIMGSAYPTSPRLVKCGVYNPGVGIYEMAGHGASKYLTVKKIVVVFIESMTGQAEVLARFMRMATTGEPCPECPNGFLFGARLVE